MPYISLLFLFQKKSNFLKLNGFGFSTQNKIIVMNKIVYFLLLGGILMLWSCKGTKTSTQKVIKKELINSNTNTSAVKKFVPNNSELLFENTGVIEKIQVILYLNNYQTGKINGEMNVETLRALTAFQKTKNIRVGDRSSKTLNMLGVNEMDFGVMELQENLERKGFSSGVIDGILGPKTRTAYQTFLRENKLIGVGFTKKIKNKLLEEIAIPREKTVTQALSNSSTKPSTPPPTKLVTAEQVKKVQQALMRKGYNPGNIDGLFSLQTKDALYKYQVDQKLPIGGFNSDTIKSLGL